MCHSRRTSTDTRLSFSETARLSARVDPKPNRSLVPDEYESLLAAKIAEERSKLPVEPEYLPDLPPHLHRKQMQINGGAFLPHYSRAYRDVSRRRDAYAETAHRLREAVSLESETLRASLNEKAHTGWELHCKTRDEAHARALDAWEARRERWDALKHALAIRHDKRPGDLAMERCDEHRRKMEILTHLDMAAPVHEREGGTQWEWRMGLRNNWTRYVAVGNVFSELYYVRDELAFADPEHVRRVRHAEDGASYSTKSGRSVLNSRYLTDRRRRLRARVANLLPGELRDEEVEALEVVGEGAHVVAAREAARRITLEDLEEEIADTSVETWAMIQKARADAARAEETRAAKRAAEDAAREAARLAALGPHCVLDAYQLSARLEVRPGGGRYDAGVSFASATLRNTGSTALFYHWTREGAEGPLTRSLPHAKGPGGASAWFLAEREGSLRPGEIKKVQWTFKAHAPGVYVDGWRLVTRPEPRGGPLPPVALRGVAVADDPNSFPRRALAQELGRAEMLNKVANVVRRVVKDVRTPERGFRNATEPPFSRIDLKGGAPVSGAKPAAFVAANLARRPRVYFHEDAFDALAAVFAEAKALRAAMPVPEGEEEEEEEGEPEEATRGPEDTGEENEAGDGAAPAAPPPWGDWDGSLAAAEAALERLERRVASDPEWTPSGPADEPDSAPDASGEEASEEDPPPPAETAAESLARLRLNFGEAVSASLVPASRADMLASSLAETLALALDGVERAARRARRAHEPRPAPPPEPAEGEDAPPGGAAESQPAAESDESHAPADAPPAPEPKWMRRYRNQLAESVSAMLGDAIDAFEGAGDVGYEAAVRDVAAETDRRAEALERRAGERRRALRFGAVKDDFAEISNLEDGAIADGVSGRPASGGSSAGGAADGAAWEAFEMRRRQRQLTRRDL